ncbi:hypothetical protein KUTeg_010260 [Tegillarca granosa]|uniref:PID domain-containing protein n=1 Tax=Tegillarca granosa TaxID=220873 RepID=A0ABQ9F961_TEGGR|nr:hypothetical protein KUTeg_010260 [Tegillarca granosa]
MEGEFYVEYLGCSSLTKPATGLGAIQTPLREKYFIYKKSGKGKKTQEVGLRVNACGIEIIFRGSHPGDPNNQVYDLESIYICEAVRFVTSKGPDKKLQAGFIPIDNSRTPNTGNEKLYSPLDKKYHSLAKVSHPPIVACVMRRSIGVKVVECHSFVAQSDDVALRIIALVDSLKYRHADHPEPNRYEQENSRNPQRTDLIRTEFGEFGIYRGGSRQTNLPDENFRGGNRPPDNWGSNGRRYSDDQEADRYLGDNRVQERYSGQFDDPRRISGDESRIIHERQRSDELRPRNGYSEREEDNRRSGEGFSESSAMRLGFNYGRPGRPSTREDGQQFRIPRPMSPVRGPGKEPPVPAPKPNRPLSPNPTHGPSDRTRYPREEASYPRDPPYSSRDQREPPYTPIEPPYSSRDQQFTPRDKPYSPRDQPYSPRDKPFTPREPVNQGPAYSQSNRESRGEEETQKKPVAKVPPHLVAGVKVLPTGFAAALKKPPSPREDSGKFIQKEKIYEDEDPYDNAISRREYYENHGSRNVKSEGDWYTKEAPYGMPPPDVLPREERDNYNERDRLVDIILRLVLQKFFAIIIHSISCIYVTSAE